MHSKVSLFSPTGYKNKPADGMSTNPDKVQKVRNWPTPQSAPEVQSFLGLASYYRTFIPAYARVVFPVTRLTEKDREFKWTQECDAAFNDIRTALTSALILAYPDLSPNAASFVLDTDANSHANLGRPLPSALQWQRARHLLWQPNA